MRPIAIRNVWHCMIHFLSKYVYLTVYNQNVAAILLSFVFAVITYRYNMLTSNKSRRLHVPVLLLYVCCMIFERMNEV